MTFLIRLLAYALLLSGIEFAIIAKPFSGDVNFLALGLASFFLSMFVSIVMDRDIN